jgi:DNA primase large subunit
MKKLPLNIKQFMPKVQQQIVSGSSEFEDVIKRLDKELEEIPQKEQSETVYTHFFYAGCDWFVLSWDRINEVVFCYVILNGDVEMSELGDVWLPELRNDSRIELDFHWDKKSLAQAKYEKYPDYFPKGC